MEAAKEDAALAGKKRSIFRSPGTASSPDLATLVRLAKEARAKTGTTPKNTGSRAVSSHQQTPRDQPRSRAVSQTSADWDGVSSNGDRRSVMSGVSSGDRMTTISEASRNRPSDDGYKVSTGPEARGATDAVQSVRNKAKGMLGRMFGSSHRESVSLTFIAGLRDDSDPKGERTHPITIK